MVDAPQVHLVTGGEIDLSSLNTNTKRFSNYLSSQHKDPLKFLVVGSEPLGRLKQLFGIKRRWLVQRDQSNLVPSYVSGNYCGYYIQLGVRGYLGLKVLRLGWKVLRNVLFIWHRICADTIQESYD